MPPDDVGAHRTHRHVGAPEPALGRDAADIPAVVAQGSVPSGWVRRHFDLVDVRVVAVAPCGAVHLALLGGETRELYAKVFDAIRHLHSAPPFAMPASGHLTPSLFSCAASLLPGLRVPCRIIDMWERVHPIRSARRDAPVIHIRGFTDNACCVFFTFTSVFAKLNMYCSQKTRIIID